MKIESVHPDSDFSDSVIPANNVLLFLGADENNNPVLRYKDSSGAFHTLGGASYTVTTLTLSRPSVDEPLFLKLYVSATGSTSDMTLAVDTTTAEGRSRVKAYFLSMGTGSWQPVSSSGLTVDYAGAHVSVDLTGISGLPGYIFYRWETASGSDQDYESMFFPSCTGNMAYAGGGYDPGPEPVWSSETSSEHDVCSSGAVITSSAVSVTYPCIWESTTVDEDGWLNVLSGGTANYTTINRGYMYISNGGTANSATVNSNSFVDVFNGGTANETTINSGGAMHVFRGGLASGTTVNSGGWMYVSSGGIANETTVNTSGSLQVYNGGTVNSAMLNSGNLVVSNGGTANATTVDYGGMYVDGGGMANSTTVNEWGRMHVYSGGTANETTVNHGGYLNVSSGGTATYTTVNAGGWMYIFSAVTVNSITVNSNGHMNIYIGGTANETIVNSVGSLTVYSGGTANQITVSSGGSLIVEEGGSATQVTSLTGAIISGNWSSN